MNALQIMSPRSIENAINWSTMENDNFRFPPLYKLFHELYDISTINVYNNYIYSDGSSLTAFGRYRYAKNNFSIILDTIFHPKDVLFQFSNLLDAEDEIEGEIIRQGFIPVAYCPGQELVVMGVSNINCDKFYWYVRDENPFLIPLEDNIFCFFKEYKVIVDEFWLYGRSFDDLYKNWNDPYWRIRRNLSTP